MTFFLVEIMGGVRYNESVSKRANQNWEAILLQWIYLIGEEYFTLNTISNMKFEDSKLINKSNEQLEIRFDNNDYVIFYKEENSEFFRRNFEPQEFKEYLKILPFDNPRWIMLKYNNVAILRKIISGKEFPSDVIIDCDGVDLGLEEVFDKSRIIENGPPAKF